MNHDGAKAAIGLLAVTAIWGSTFGITKDAVAFISPMEFIALRFGIAAIVLGAFWWKSVRDEGRRMLKAGAIAGAVLAVGYLLQTFGLKYTTATNAALVTGMFVVFTPILSALILKRAPGRLPMIGVVLATTGLAALALRTTPGLPAFRSGDVIVLFAALSFALHVIVLGRWAPGGDVRAFAVLQLAFAAVISALVMPFDAVRVPPPQTWWALAITGVGASAFAFAMQTWAQSRLSPTRTAVMLTMEPVFGALFGVFVLSERLTTRGWIGAALIIAGAIVAEVRVQDAN